jgi:hypothetical protein
MVVRRVVRRLALFSRFATGTGGGNCVTIGLFEVVLRLADVEVDKTPSMDLFSALREVLDGSSVSLEKRTDR